LAIIFEEVEIEKLHEIVEYLKLYNRLDHKFKNQKRIIKYPKELLKEL